MLFDIRFNDRKRRLFVFDVAITYFKRAINEPIAGELRWARVLNA